MKREFSLCGMSFLLAAGSFVAAALISGANPAGGAEPGPGTGTTLVFEPTPDPAVNVNPRPDSVTLDRLVAVLKQRVAGQKVVIRRIENGRIEVLIDTRDPATVRRIGALLKQPGTLEFRILANDRDHKDIMNRALAEKSPVVKSKAPDEKGEYPTLAWWVPLKGSERFKDRDKRDAAKERLDDVAKTQSARDEKRIAGLLAYPEICSRTVAHGDKEITEVLVAEDMQDVTGQYLTEASAGADSRGKPCVNFRFNTEGAARFGALTGNNLPEQGSQFTRKLGIILDGCLYSAPAIRSTISDRGQISGEFTKEEVQDLVSSLNAGSLPIPIRLVENDASAPKNP